MDPQRNPKKRKRTEKQLERKRVLDRETQRAKRGSDRERLEQIQRDMQSMHQRMAEMQRSLNIVLGVLRGRSAPCLRQPSEADERGIQAGNSTTLDATEVLEIREESQQQQHLHDPLASSISNSSNAVSPASTRETFVSTRIAVSSLSRSPPPRKPSCVCHPTVHASYAECFEQTVYEAIMKGHSPPGPIGALPSPPIPRLPSLSDLLFIGQGENLVTQTIMKMLRRNEVTDLPSLLSAFLLVYWVLRYRFYPCPETLHGIPAWLRPTEIQDSTPHEIWTDFVHFPRLRDALASGTFKCSLEEFGAVYAASISTNWPSWQPLFVRNRSGADVVLNPDFEAHISLMSNWSLDENFARTYPELVELVTIRM